MSEQLHIERSEAAPGEAVIRLSGSLRLAGGSAAWTRLHEALANPVDVLRIDLSAVDELDGAGASFLLAARADAANRGYPMEFAGARDKVARMLDLYGCPSEFGCLKEPPHKVGLLDQIGRNAVTLGRGFRDVLGYTGDLAAAVALVVRRPRSVHWADVPKLMEKAGADGAPIVVLINFLVGLIISLQAAGQLARFGANVFIADLVGLSMTRELAPLMTAIIVSGRSGAAFAAELGTMRVSEEIDALRTLGLDPQRHLVLPRMIALGLVVPVLTLIGIAVGVLGGLVIGITQLDLTPIGFWNQLDGTMRPLDLVEGMTKSCVFAVLITFIACQRGLATRGGAAGVGASTTSAVVTTLFHIVATDTLMSLAFNSLRS